MGQDYHWGSCGRSGTISTSRRDASSSGTEVPVQSQRDQQRKNEVEIEDISYSSSTSQFRGSIFGEPIEEGTEFNEDIFPQQTVVTELGDPLDCDEV